MTLVVLLYNLVLFISKYIFIWVKNPQNLDQILLKLFALDNLSFLIINIGTKIIT